MRNKRKNPVSSKTRKSYGPYIKHKLGLLGSPKIIPFIGYGNNTVSYISGIVVEENGIIKPQEGQPKWQNIKAMMKRYLSNELENIKVRITYDGMSQIVTTDKYGIFRCNFENHSGNGAGELWKKASVSIMEPVYRLHQKDVARGEVMIVGHSPQFGIISDIDDTILVSYATRKLMKLRLMLLNNAHTRMPFEGVAAFYNALQLGTVKDGYNPIFYVSNSEWNLYDLLYEFVEFHRIPKGPFFLRELAIRVLRPWKIREVNKNHKIQAIRKIFSLYGEMKFILIGDSGQKDPQIYSDLVKEFPGRVLAVYIRDAGIRGNLPRIKIISERVQDEFKTEMLLVKDTEAAARHAVQKGFITEESLTLILDEKQKDLEKKEKPAEKLV